MNVVEAKASLRRELRAKLELMSASERAVESSLICGRVAGQEFWKNARTVLLFAPLPDEVNIWPLLKRALAEGKTLALPQYRRELKSYGAAQVRDLEVDLNTAKFGILEPAAHCPTLSLAEIDLAVVPGVGFDRQGNRLGRGRGFYDQLLARFTGTKCGVAWDVQRVAKIPTEELDVPMEVVLTASASECG